MFGDARELWGNLDNLKSMKCVLVEAYENTCMAQCMAALKSCKHLRHSNLFIENQLLTIALFCHHLYLRKMFAFGFFVLF